MAGTSEEHGQEVLKNLQIAALLSTLGGQRVCNSRPLLGRFEQRITAQVEALSRYVFLKQV